MDVKDKIFKSIRTLSLYISEVDEFKEFLIKQCGASDTLINLFKRLNQEIKDKAIDVKDSIYSREDEIWNLSQVVIIKLVQNGINFVKDQLNKLTNDEDKKKKIDTMFSHRDLSDFSVIYIDNLIDSEFTNTQNKEAVRKAKENISRNIYLISATKAASRIKEIYQTSACIYEKISNKLSGNNSELEDLSYDNIFQHNERAISEITKTYNIQNEDHPEDIDDANLNHKNEDENHGKQNISGSETNEDQSDPAETKSGEKAHDNKKETGSKEGGDSDKGEDEKPKKTQSKSSLKKTTKSKKVNKKEEESNDKEVDNDSDDNEEGEDENPKKTQSKSSLKKTTKSKKVNKEEEESNDKEVDNDSDDNDEGEDENSNNSQSTSKPSDNESGDDDNGSSDGDKGRKSPSKTKITKKKSKKVSAKRKSGTSAAKRGSKKKKS